MKLHAFQRLMKELYFPRDVQRGVEKTFMWLTEEVGELGRAIRTLILDWSVSMKRIHDVLAVHPSE